MSSEKGPRELPAPPARCRRPGSVSEQSEGSGQRSSGPLPLGAHRALGRRAAHPLAHLLQLPLWAVPGTGAPRCHSQPWPGCSALPACRGAPSVCVRACVSPSGRAAAPQRDPGLQGGQAPLCQPGGFSQCACGTGDRASFTLPTSRAAQGPTLGRASAGPGGHDFQRGARGLGELPGGAPSGGGPTEHAPCGPGGAPSANPALTPGQRGRVAGAGLPQARAAGSRGRGRASRLGLGRG